MAGPRPCRCSGWPLGTPTAGPARGLAGPRATIGPVCHRYERESVDKPDGPKVDLKPGKYTVTVKMPGKKAMSEEITLGADESWGVIILPDGPLPLQVY